MLEDWFSALNENVQVWCQAHKHRGQAWGEVSGNVLVLDCSKQGVYNVLIIGTRQDKDAKENWHGVEVAPEPESEENTNGTSSAQDSSG